VPDAEHDDDVFGLELEKMKLSNSLAKRREEGVAGGQTRDDPIAAGEVKLLILEASCGEDCVCVRVRPVGQLR
jgi:hypothetical protein